MTVFYIILIIIWVNPLIMVIRSNFEGKKGYILCISAVIILLIGMAYYSYLISELANQIITQAEYIESQEWREYVETDSQKESEHMNMLEEMRKGNEQWEYIERNQ